MIIPMLLILLSSSALAQTDWNYIPFDCAMEKDTYLPAIASTERIIDINGDMLYGFFKRIYEELNLSAISADAELKIPKIIHQIWLGSELPEEFIALQQSWIEYHLGRDWLYKLWTDEDVANMELYNKAFYDATDNYGIKSDILRWEILYNFGGVYIDMDFECLRALDQFN